MKNNRILAILFLLILTGTTIADSYTVSLKSTTQPTPPIGSLSFNPAFSTKNASDKGLKLGSTNNYVGWLLPTSETITAASFSGYIDSNRTSDTFGYAFSTDGGQSWGATKKCNSDGKKTESVYTIPVSDIPSGANAIKVIRTAGTSTYICSISIETSGGTTPSAPSITSFAVAGVSATIDQTNHTITATLPAGTDLTSLTPTVAIADADSYSPTGVQNFTNPVQFTVTKGTVSVSYTVTLTVASTPVPPTSAPSITSFTVAGVSAYIDHTHHAINAILPAGTDLTSLTPTVAIADADSYSPTVAQNFTNPVQYIVTKGSVSVSYTVTLTVASTPVTPDEPDVPATSLTLHEQEIYEGSEYAGGYGTPLVKYNVREYEVYYVLRPKNPSGSKFFGVATRNSGSYSVVDGSDPQNTEKATKARDGWFKGTAQSMEGDADISEGSKASAAEEFAAMPADAKMYNNDAFELYVKGYDQFRLYARDNDATESKGRHFDVYIDGVKQTMTLAKSATIRTFSMTQSAHLIRIVGLGGSNNYFYGFSLRLSNQPRVKYLSGNDSDQVVIQETAIAPVRYVVRNNISNRLDWVGSPATGITLSPLNEAGDTLQLTGTAQCPVGTYTYNVVALDAANTVVSSVTGSFKVATKVYPPADGTEHTVWINDPMTPVVYTYNAINDADISFSWTTQPAGVTTSQDNTDNTYTISGTPTVAGEYAYTIAAAGGNTINGKLIVDVPAPMIIVPADSITKVKATQALVPVVWEVKFAKSVSTTGLPTGLNGTYANGQFTISGTPATETSYPKTYTYTVTAEPLYTGKPKATAKGQIIVIDPKAKSFLYLYSDTYKDGIYNYLNTKNYDITARPADETARTADSYSAYNMVIISENVDANNQEAISIARGDFNVPVLNMKVFLYTTSRIGWGFPDNGSLVNKDITVLQPSHPVFRGLQAKEWGTISILSGIANKRGLMPVNTNLNNSVALATVPCRGDDYYSNGEEATFLHEIPASLRKAKYILLPIGQATTDSLSAQGKTLLDNIVTYLLDATSSFAAPELRITSFRINGQDATINEAAQTITLIVPDETDLKALQPQVAVLSTGTWVTPSDGEVVDFSDTHYGVNYTVTDGINQKVYNVIVRTATAVDNIIDEGLWYDGTTLHNDNNIWVNIYDAAGRKLTTTNSSYSFTALPTGIYLLQTPTTTLRILW